MPEIKSHVHWQPDELCRHNKFPCWKSMFIGSIAGVVGVVAGMALAIVVVALWINQ